MPMTSTARRSYGLGMSIDQAIDNYDAWPKIAAVRGGDAESFAEVYRTYAPHIRRYFDRRIHDESTVEDLTSETFLRCFRTIDQVRDVGRPFGAWLNTIARNLLIDLYKSAAYRHERPVAHHDDQRPSTDLDPLEHVIRSEQASEIQDALQDLTTEQRRCLQLRFWQDLTINETAQYLERAPSAVKQLQHRAVRGLAVPLRGIGHA
jgi:RNA polymerase sigma-70 factor (ECF subfamily)